MREREREREREKKEKKGMAKKKENYSEEEKLDPKIWVEAQVEGRKLPINYCRSCKEN